MSMGGQSKEQRADGEALERAVAAFQAGRPDEAERLADAVLTRDPRNLRAAQMLGQARLLLGRADGAIEPLRRAAELADDPTTDTLLARALAATGHGDEALQAARRGAARTPPHPLAFLELGDQLGKAGRFAEGIEVFERGLALMPGALVLNVGLGHLHLARNERDAARQLFLAALSADPARRDAMIGLAMTLALDGDHAGAAGQYRRALAGAPSDAATRIALSKCLLELGERAQGEAMLRTVAHDAPWASGLALAALASVSHGRTFLRPSAARRFLAGEPA
jgi:tetratricopeptide (TPR) repeat protein